MKFSINELPPLPTATRGSLVGDWVPVYTADQMRDYARAAIGLHEQQSHMQQSQPIGQNAGHGHVFPRPDGVRMRCGGPAICKVCALDFARKLAMPEVKP